MKLLHIFLSVFISTLLIGSAANATSYTWTGTTDTTWANSTNWSPAGVPGSGDNVTIFSNTNSPSISANTTITNLTFPSDTLRLNGYTLTVNGTCALTGGTVTAGNLICRGTFVNFAGSKLKCYVDAVCGQIKFNGSVFDSTAYIEQTGYANGVGAGGNIFNQAVTIKNSSPYILRTAESTGDVFNAELTLVVTNIKDIQLSYAAASIYNGNIYLNTTNTGGIAFSTSGNGSSTLASGKQLIIGGTGFANGVLLLNNIIQQGSTAQSIALSAGTLNIIGSTFNGPVTFSAANILSKTSTFNATTSLTKTGISNNYWDGGNTFNGTTSITNNATGNYNLRMALTTGDIYAGDITFNASNTYTGAINVAYAGTTEFKGNVSINNAKVTFNAGTGTVKFSGGNSQTLSGSAAYAMLYAIVNKSANNVTLNQPMTVDSSLTLTNGNIISTSTNLLTMKAGSTVSGASDSSYLDGPVKKIGNSAFTFPTGKGGNYRSIGISAPSNSTDAFTGEFINSGQSYNTNSSGLDSTLMDLSDCEYWTLNRNTGSSTVQVKLTWDSSSCFLSACSAKRVASWSGSVWNTLGNYSTTGDSITGSILSSSTSSTYNAFAIALNRKGNSCSNAISYVFSDTSFYTTQPNEFTDSVMWFSFVPDTANNLICLGIPRLAAFADITSFSIYSGSCGSLSLRKTHLVDDSINYMEDSLFYINDTLTPGNTYFVKVTGHLTCSTCGQKPNGYFNIFLFRDIKNVPMICEMSHPCNILMNTGFEDLIINPVTSNPFNVAAALHSVCSWERSHGIPSLIQSPMNNFAYMRTVKVLGDGIMQAVSLTNADYVLSFDYYESNPGSNPVVDNFYVKLTQSIQLPVANNTIPNPLPAQTIAHLQNISNTTWNTSVSCFHNSPLPVYDLIYMYPQANITVPPNLVSQAIAIDNVKIQLFTVTGQNQTLSCTGADQTIQLGMDNTCITSLPGMTFLWSQTGGPSLTITNGTTANATVTIPVNNSPIPILYTFNLLITAPGGTFTTIGTVVVTAETCCPMTFGVAPIHGCTSGSLGFSVNVLTGVGPYTVQWSGPSPSTSPQSFSTSSTSITSLTTGTYSVIVTSTNGCSNTATITIAPEPTPNATFDGRNLTCDPLPLTYTAQSGYTTYSWSIPAGITYTQSAHNLFVTDWGSFTNGNLGLTVTDQYGCQASFNYFINECCTSSAYQFNNVNVTWVKNNTSLINLSTGTATITNESFDINGTFLVDQDLVLNVCTISMGQNAKIEIGSGKTLTITGSNISGCNHMWNQIFVPYNGHLIMHKAIVKDGIDAVYNTGTGRIVITDCAFDNNYHSISLNQAPSSVPPDLSASAIAFTHFDCSGTLKNNPNGYLYSYDHLVLNSVIGVDIGTTGFGNYFMGTATNGIRSFNSEYTSVANSFTNTSTVNPTCGMNNYLSSATVLDGNLFETSYGIFSNNSSLNVARNDFYGNFIGIMHYGSRKKNLNVVNNYFEDPVRAGIWTMFNYPQSYSNFEANRMNNYNPATSPVGISITESVPLVSVASVNKVDNNTIDGFNVGIRLANVFGPQVINGNNITVPDASVNASGIEVSNCYGALVEESVITGNSQSNVLCNGILVDASSVSKVLCNNIREIGVGQLWKGNSMSSFLSGNDMDYCTDELRLDNNPGLGFQYSPYYTTSDNKWGNNTSNHTYAQNNSNNAFATTFIVRNSSSPSAPLTNTDLPIPPYSLPSSYQVMTNIGDDFCDLDGTPASRNISVEIAVAKDAVQSSVDEQNERWISKYLLYEQIKNDTAFASLDISLQNAEDSIAYGNIGLFRSVADSLNKVLSDTVISDEVRETKIAAIETVNEGITPYYEAETYTKQVNEIYLATVARNYLVFTEEQILNLREIAALCPYVYGSAVFQARAFISFVDLEFADYSTACNEVGSRLANPVTNRPLDNTFTGKLYPNPNNGNMQFDYKLNENSRGLLTINDMDGRQVASYSLSDQQNVLYINQKLSSGVYQCHVFVDDVLKDILKLIIVK